MDAAALSLERKEKIMVKSQVMIKSEVGTKSKEAKRAALKRELVWYSFLIIPILTLILLTYVPLLTTIRYSFYSVSVVGFGEEFIGWRNYTMLLTNPQFQRSIFNTFILTFYGLMTIPLGFILASLINGLGKTKWQSFFRIMFYVPNIITGVAVVLIFQAILRTNGGLLNEALSFISGQDVRIGWLSDPSYARAGVTIIAVWAGLGYSMLINLASLQSIEQEVYEAAAIDGATSLKAWWYITIPQMTHCFAFLFITSVIGGLSRFTDLFIIGGNNAAGLPGGVLQTMLMFIFSFSFETPQFGIASAGAMILFVFTLLITLINLHFTGFFKKKGGK